ncbi:hypothetical protein [Embleya scabrispora]|uniref:hypothetical protein n=1 Tax=Embleya scabrispora TaxID=159449 RepID=UPI000376E16C|nr:hypothetical protein [Embleya scabrispora]MYS87781.1 hypothetical protein [Streptomyces sp. SID5474]
MPFTGKTPLWQRYKDCSHMAVMLTHVGGGEITVVSESVRGDDATETLADLLMEPGGRGGMVLHPGLVGVVVRPGIDVMWMAQPPIKVATGDGNGEWQIAVDAEGTEVTVSPWPTCATSTPVFRPSTSPSSATDRTRRALPPA